MGNTDQNLKVEIGSVRKIISEKHLSIPEYQRPYTWKEKNVIQLLTDIQEAIESPKEKYRIGTVILHCEDTKLNIVDGQQRLVTITIVLNCLKVNHELPLLKSDFRHIDSKNNISFNYRKIIEWVDTELVNNKQKAEFREYLLDKCEFVRIELAEVSEAFQLFDSQNARGKVLEPYDLLKAFHLREMKDNNEVERKECAIKWEKAVNEGLLNNLGKYIYRIRKWARGENAGEFTKDNLDEFKGINLNQSKKYPYLKSYQVNDSLISELGTNFVKPLVEKIQFPFQITQFILNGRLFFEFVSFYSGMYQALFTQNHSNFYLFYKKYCLYDGSLRIGDTYVREMFESAILFFAAKFGEGELKEIERVLYKWSYILRLEKSRVNYLSIDKYIRDKGNVFKIIDQNYHPKGVRMLKPAIPKSPSFYIPSKDELFDLFKSENGTEGI
jgi:hypothetical protein